LSGTLRDSEIMINRQAEINQFQTFLGSHDDQWLMVFYGLAGLGKTALLQHLFDTLKPGYIAIMIDFDQIAARSDFNTSINELDRALEGSGLSTETLRDYRCRAQKIDEQIEDRQVEIKLIINAYNSKVSDISQNVDYAQFMLQFRLEGARKRIINWLKLAKNVEQRWVIFIDHWDALVELGAPEVYRWVIDDFLCLASQALKGFRTVMASGSLLKDSRLEQVAQQVPLTPLGKDDSLNLLIQYEVDDKDVREFIFERTGGNPFLQRLAARLWKERPDLDLRGLDKELPVQAAAAWILNELSSRIKDSRTKTALEQGVVLEWFNRDVLAAVCEAEDFDMSWYSQFTTYPFIESAWKRPGYSQFVRLVRRIRIDALWQQNRKLFWKLHSKAHAWYADRANLGTNVPRIR